MWVSYSAKETGSQHRGWVQETQGVVCLAQSLGLVAPSTGWAPWPLLPTHDSHKQCWQRPACCPSWPRSLRAVLLWLPDSVLLSFYILFYGAASFLVSSKYHKHRQEYCAINDRVTAPGASGRGPGGSSCGTPSLLHHWFLPPRANHAACTAPNFILIAEQRHSFFSQFLGKQYGAPHSQCF